MGATPELIDLLQERDAEQLTIVDMAQDQWDAIQGFGREDWSGVDWVCGDWLKPISGLRGQLDYVCCDGGTLFLDWSKAWKRLFEVAFDYLRPGGVFVTKAQDMRDPGASLQQILLNHIARFEEARRRAPSAEVEHFRQMASSLHVAMFLGTQRVDFSMDPEPAAQRLRQVRDALRIRYNESHFRPFIDIFFGEMDPLENPRAVLAASPPPGAVFSLLAAVGFEVEHHPLPLTHAPGPNVCYMIAARRPAS